MCITNYNGTQNTNVFLNESSHTYLAQVRETPLIMASCKPHYLIVVHYFLFVR